jgi:hypothetical protein
MKKPLMVALWSFGIFYGLVFFFGILYGMVHLHRFSLKPSFFLATHAYIAYISYLYLREELGGPIVRFNAEKPLSSEHVRELRSLWKKTSDRAG